MPIDSSEPDFDPNEKPAPAGEITLNELATLLDNALESSWDRAVFCGALIGHLRMAHGEPSARALIANALEQLSQNKASRP